MMREFNFATTPIVDIVNDIIIDSVVRNASDIHLDPAEKYLKIRIRIDGELRDYTIIDNKYKRNLTTRIKLLAGMNITESRLPQDGAIKSVIEGKDLDLRVSALPTSFGEKIVIRILDYSMSMQGLEYLGFTNENYNIITDLINSPNGIILITGATGSGKSTTVYSMLQRLNKEETNIITVEDPVEMSIEGLNQVQVNSEIGLDFAAVLRSILRQDPNVILIGEIRDSETARIAIRASITGHLVLSTLHTNNSLTTIERLIDMDVERYLLSSSLKGIISQTLAKRLCNNCKVQREATPTEKTIYKKALGLDINYLYEAHGCDNCHNGYRGRIALQEVLMINDEIREAINNNIDREELRTLIYSKGAKTLLQDGLIKTLEGITDLKEVLRLVDYDESDSLFKNSENIEYNKTDNNEIENNYVENNNQYIENIEPATNFSNKAIDLNNSENNQIININNDNSDNYKESVEESNLNNNNIDLNYSFIENEIPNNFNTNINSIPIENNDIYVATDYTANITPNNYNTNNISNDYSSNVSTKDVNDIINYYNSNQSSNINISDNQNNTSFNDNSTNIFNNNNISGNLFDDNIFNSLRVDTNSTDYTSNFINQNNE